MTQLPVFYTFIIVYTIYSFFILRLLYYIIFFYLANLPYKNFRKKRFYAVQVYMYVYNIIILYKYAHTCTYIRMRAMQQKDRNFLFISTSLITTYWNRLSTIKIRVYFGVILITIRMHRYTNNFLDKIKRYEYNNEKRSQYRIHRWPNFRFLDTIFVHLTTIVIFLSLRLHIYMAYKLSAYVFIRPYTYRIVY